MKARRWHASPKRWSCRANNERRQQREAATLRGRRLFVFMGYVLWVMGYVLCVMCIRLSVSVSP